MVSQHHPENLVRGDSMPSITMKKKYFVRELVGATRVGEYYLIVDPENDRGLAVVEEQTEWPQIIARAFLDKAFLPISLVMKNVEGAEILRISKPASLLNSAFTVRNADGKVLCVLKNRISLFRPYVSVEDEKGQSLGNIEGCWKFRLFQFRDNNGNPVSTVRHLYGGIARELLTTADDYEVDIHADSAMTLISLAATICIDFLFHES
ncbi:MAG TPA: phospholipid scramblase-related protein [Candidatus Rifleibacterium sp.]|nr:phospholipid scramblase-related protein [Candidatus Rifleibacterium sp.]